MTPTTRRTLAGIVLPGIATIGTAVLLAATAGDLPDPVASHWSLSGTPDGSAGRATLFVLFIGVVLACGVALAVVSRRSSSRGDLVMPVVGLTFLQWVFAGVAVAVVVANHGVDEWTDARELPIVIALLVPAVAGVVAWLAGALMAPVGDKATSPPSTTSTVGRAVSDRMEWTGHASARWPWILAAGLICIGVLGLVWSQPIVGLVLICVGLLVSIFGSLEVIVDQRGLTVHYGMVGWPTSHVALDRIVDAAVVEITPMSHGGWGYRGGLKLFGRAAVVVRRGDGIQLDLTDDRTFSVTVDDATTGAGTLTNLLAARPEPTEAD